MIKETIQAVEDAEKKASDMLTAASEAGRRQVDEAKAEAEQLKAEAARKGKEADARLESALAEKGEQYLQEAMKSVQADIAVIRDTAEKKAPHIIVTIISELV